MKDSYTELNNTATRNIMDYSKNSNHSKQSSKSSSIKGPFTDFKSDSK